MASGIRPYMDLSEYDFYSDDKKHVCEYIIAEKISLRKFAQDHKLKKSRIIKWMGQYKKFIATGFDTFYSGKGGRPSSLDAKSSIELCNCLKQGRRAQNAPTPSDVRKKIDEEVKASAERRGVGNAEGICRRTRYNIKKVHDCEEGKCQFKTKARIINEADPRNVYTMACMLWAFCALLAACMVFNWDATQFYVDLDGEQTAVYIKGATGESDIPLTRQSSGSLGISVKYYHFHNSAGETAPAVYIVADDSMSDDDFFVLPIVGLGNSTEVGSKAYLCWCKTRNCNDKFYRWFAKEIVIPFVNLVHDTHQEKVC